MSKHSTDVMLSSEKTKMDTYFISKKTLWIVLGALLFVYTIASIFVNITIRTDAVFVISGQEIPVRSFAGVFSSIANLCIIFLVILYKKNGFIISLIILLGQVPMLVIELFKHNYSSMSGLFAEILIIMAICLIYFSQKKVGTYQKEVREQATIDRLTRLPNRFTCYERMNDLIKSNKKFVIAIMNLNNFKSINNALGQAIGDAILIEIASRLKNAFVNDNSKLIDFITYNGGDEFALIIHNYNNEDEIIKVIEYYRSVLNEKITFNGCDYFITARIGFAEYAVDAQDSETLYAHALTAMTSVKDSNDINNIYRFSSNMHSDEKHIEMERKIRLALEENRVYYVMQPQFNIEHKLRGFEVLARIHDVDGSTISPLDFIPVAEKVDLIDRIDFTVFKNSAKFLGEIIKKTNADVTLSVNISARHLMKNNFLNEVKEVVDTCGVPANKLEIEITESIMIVSIDEAMHSVDELKKMGIKVAIDDFGTGYSSLSYLNKFPADILKIDKSFIDEINLDDSHKKYVSAIISIGHLMNLEVVAEGVEKIEQFNVLKDIGCDYIQGYYWGKPMLPSDAEKIIYDSLKK